MTKKELLETYNLTLDDTDGRNFDGLAALLVDFGIATDGEIELITNINGATVESLLDIVYCRCGLRSIEQLINEYHD